MEGGPKWADVGTDVTRRGYAGIPLEGPSFFFRRGLNQGGTAEFVYFALDPYIFGSRAFFISRTALPTSSAVDPSIDQGGM